MEDRQKTIHEIREFNRFYTVLSGFLNRNYLDSGYSVTETRILFELKQNGQMTANRLITMLRLDKSYVSRLIRNFEQKCIITRETDPEDRRTLIIRLTPRGRLETSLTGYLRQQVHGQSGGKGKQHDKYKIDHKVPDAQNDLQRSQIGDFGGRPGEHKCRRAAHAHPIHQPSLQKRDRSSAAGIQRHADRSRHQDAERLVAAEEVCH